MAGYNLWIESPGCYDIFYPLSRAQFGWQLPCLVWSWIAVCCCRQYYFSRCRKPELWCISPCVQCMTRLAHKPRIWMHIMLWTWIVVIMYRLNEADNFQPGLVLAWLTKLRCRYGYIPPMDSTKVPVPDGSFRTELTLGTDRYSDFHAGYHFTTRRTDLLLRWWRDNAKIF